MKSVAVIAVGLFFLSMSCTYNDQLALYNTHITGKEIVTGMTYGSRITVTGKACIVKTSADLKKVNAGDIVVTVMTQESWASSLQKSSGIITNLGDSNCHAVAYGKKKAIPVIVGAGNATEKIVDGHLITVDCSQGSIGCVYCPEKEKQNDCFMPSTPRGHADFVVHGSTKYQASAEHKAEEMRSASVTKEFFNKHYNSFVSYVLKMQNDISWRNWIGESAMFISARKVGGCGDFAIKCIPLAYDFFDLTKDKIESILREIEIDYVNLLFEKYYEKPGDMEWLARVSHTEHIKKISLPSGVNKEELIEHPKKYKKFIDQKKIDAQQKDVLIASGLFVRYCVEKKVRFV